MEAESPTVEITRSKSRTPAISVVAPCHNEENNLDELERRVSGICRRLVSESYEIVLVNDGSRDNTWEVISRLAATKPNVVGVNLSRNYGHQLALTAGLRAARGDRILIIDADLQDPPELLPQMMDKMDRGVDVVYGLRNKRLGDSAVRAKSSDLFYRLLNLLTDVYIPVDTGDFRCISRRVLDEFLRMPEHHRFIRGMISWIGFRQEPIIYDRQPRQAGETSYTLSRLICFAVDAITGFSVRPLKVAIFVGSGLAMLSLFFLGYCIVLWLGGRIPVAGWLSIVTVQVLSSAVMMLYLGLLGEYVGRILQEVKNRPLYIVESMVSSSQQW